MEAVWKGKKKKYIAEFKSVCNEHFLLPKCSAKTLYQVKRYSSRQHGACMNSFAVSYNLRFLMVRRHSYAVDALLGEMQLAETWRGSIFFTYVSKKYLFAGETWAHFY
jgi:hypothetical protein